MSLTLGMTEHGRERLDERNIFLTDADYVVAYSEWEDDENGFRCRLTGKELLFHWLPEEIGRRLLDLVVILTFDGRRLITAFERD